MQLPLATKPVFTATKQRSTPGTMQKGISALSTPVRGLPNAFPERRTEMATHHTSTMPAIGNGITDENTSESSENAKFAIQREILGSEAGKDAVAGDMKDLELKLRELEEEKNAIDLRRSRVEVDIAALQRVMQLIATKYATEDVILDLKHA